jgi:hypothetical protein
MRCKKPWHLTGERCPLDKFDETLEAWKEISGAQKCPACFKLIEKDDPDTCNHMVHKITDGIPCIHDRTDFCYLCGELVTADYPHDEVYSRSYTIFFIFISLNMVDLSIIMSILMFFRSETRE